MSLNKTYKDVSGQTVVYAGIPFELQVQISGVNGGGQIEITGVSQFENLGRATSSNVSIINGNVSANVTHTYTFISPNTGEFTIGPAKTVYNNKTLTSNTIKTKVIEQPQGAKTQQTPTNTQQNIGPASQDENEEEDEFLQFPFHKNIRKRQPTQPTEVFCTLKTSSENVFKGQAIILSIKIYTYGPILQLGLEDINLPGFLKNEIKQESKYNEPLNNKNYTVLEKKIIIVPLKEGKVELGPIGVIYTTPTASPRTLGNLFFGGIFGRAEEQNRILSSKTTLNILPLPQGQKTPDGIGVFTKLSINTDKKIVNLNDPITLSVEIEGEGNFEQISPIALKLPDYIKSYESKTTSFVNPENDGLKGKKHFEYVIQVGKAGIIQIPEQEFYFFNPKERNYYTLKSSPVSLDIKPISEQIQKVKPLDTQISQEDKKIEQKQISDINFIEEEIKISHASPYKEIPFWIFLIFIFIPPILYTQIHKRFYNFFTQKIFKKQIYQKKLTLHHKKLDAFSKKEEIEKLYQFFIDFFATKWELDQSLVTHEVIQENLIQEGFDRKHILDFLDFLNECANFHFGAQKTDLNKNKKRILFEKSFYWLTLFIK
jgi:hypothetical protein